MNAEWLLHTFYGMEKVLEDNNERFSFIERNKKEPTTLMRISIIEKQIPYPSYVFAEMPNMNHGIDVFLYKDSYWRYLGLHYLEEEETIRFHQGMMSDEGVQFFDLSKGRVFQPIRDLLYEHFVQHPTYRLKEATGLIQR